MLGSIIIADLPLAGGEGLPSPSVRCEVLRQNTNIQYGMAQQLGQNMAILADEDQTGSNQHFWQVWQWQGVNRSVVPSH